jgi:CspA family cold shock protein
MQGTIKRILRDKGFGFIEPHDGSADVFFNRASMDERTDFDSLAEGDSVEFQSRQGDKGPRASNVKAR